MTYQIINDDCLNAMRQMEDNSIDFVVCDPPYGIEFMGRHFDRFKDQPAFNPTYWKEALRICKPGSMLAAFGGDRTHHHLMVALEQAGWEIRTCCYWLTGQGFPKSHNFGCKCKGVPVPYNHERKTKSTTHLSSMQDGFSNPLCVVQAEKQSSLQLQVQGCHTSKSSRMDGAYEENRQQWEREKEPIKGAEIREESGLEGWRDLQEEQRKLHRAEICEMSTRIHGNGEEGRLYNGTSPSNGKTLESDFIQSGSSSSQGSQHTEQPNRKPRAFCEQQRTQNRRGETCETCKGIIGFEGYGTALKPAAEIIVLAMKPLDGTYAQNAEKWGVAGINIDASRIGTEERTNNPAANQDREKWRMNQGAEAKTCKGRWPSNLLLCPEAAAQLDQMTGVLKSGSGDKHNKTQNGGYHGKFGLMSGKKYEGDSGGASRFFKVIEDEPQSRMIYCAKSSTAERQGSKHPTIKPKKLLAYLIKLLAPPGDPICLDPFMGSGTCGVVCKELGIRFIGIELEKDYFEDAKKRIDLACVLQMQFDI